MEQKIKLSQCMIVKNEEKNLRRALSWGRDIMWEQIVVDTGSTDRTVALAEQMGAKVYHFPWVDDFAAAKNYALEQAQGDWIVFLDADEYFLPEDAGKLVPLLEELQDSGFHAVTAGWIQIDEDTDVLQSRKEGKLEWLRTARADGGGGFSLAGTQVRIFRNQPGLRYQGRIHENLCMAGGQVRCMDAGRELSILHTGYSAAEMKEKKKTERNIALIRQEIAQHPHDYKLLIYLGDSYFQQKNYKEAAHCYETAVLYLPEDLGEDNIQGAMLFKHLLLIYMESEEYEAAAEAYEKGTARFPKEADYDYLAGRGCTYGGRFREGAFYLQRALGLLERYGSESRSALLAHNLLEAWELLIRCDCENGDLQQCVSRAVTVLRAAPYTCGVLKNMLMSFRKDEEANQGKAASALQVRMFLGNLYDLQKAADRRFVLEAAKDAGYDGMAALLENDVPEKS